MGQTSAEIASLDAIISYGSVSPLEIRLTPEENTSVNLSCSIFTSEGEEVGNFFSQRWFSGAKHCGDIKHTLALHLNYFLGIELSSLRTIGGAGTKLAWLQDLDKYNSMAFAGKVNLDESAWVDFAIEAQRSGYAFDSVEEKLPIAILDHLKSGKLVDTDTFQVIGAVVQRDEGFPNEFFGIPKNEPVLMHSAERSVDWEEAWGDGKLAFVSVQDDAILYGKEDAFTRDSLVAQREAFADFNRFLSYTYIDYSTVFRTGQ